MEYTIHTTNNETLHAAGVDDVVAAALAFAREGEAVSVDCPAWQGAYVGTYLCPGEDGVHASPKYFSGHDANGFGGAVPTEARAIASRFTAAAKGMFPDA